MRMIIATLVLCCRANAADLWLYAESTGVQCTRSRLLTEALCEPMESLSGRLPDHDVMASYLDELQAARDELHSLGTVTVRDRDSARLHWECETPSYGLSAYETPRPLHPECYVHPLGIVRHLIYLSRIADAVLDGEPWADSHSRPKANAWLEWRKVSRVNVTFGNLEQTEEIDLLLPRIEPAPAVNTEPPVRVSIRWRSTASDKSAVSITRYCGGCHRAQLEAVDMGSGIILRPE